MSQVEWEALQNVSALHDAHQNYKYIYYNESYIKQITN